VTRLILVRHGQTDWNVEGRYQGQADRPLNVTGRGQARALAELLIGAGVHAIYSSDLQRARQTAEVIARRIGVEPALDPRLREINQGVWEGLLLSEIIARYPREWAERERDPLHSRPPGGESIADVAARIWAAVADIAQRHPEGPVLVVSHGTALGTLICEARELPLAEARQHIPPNAAPVEVEWPLRLSQPPSTE
jgi:broad specificity phosphatase PhoE